MFIYKTPEKQASVLDYLYVVILVSSCNHVVGHLFYQKLIPNGNSVANPCHQGLHWNGVGHSVASGGGNLNPFGQDFIKEGRQWTTKLCLKDSDGDGRRNGEELGDPLCKWTMGEEPERMVNITHPGVCEPVSSRRCESQRSLIKCQRRNACSAKNSADTLTFDAVFPTSAVPPRVTSYYCKTFALPDDRDYHIVATEPVINNHIIVHHMDLYACPELEEMPYEERPFECMMGAECSEMIAGWALGEGGMCTNRLSGIRFGRSSFRFIRLQIHWNNEGNKSNMFDSSGLKLFYTPNLRKYDLGQLISAQLYLRIPPNKKKVITYPAICSGQCTKSFLPHPIHVTGVNLHMHFAGKSIYLEQFRNGTKIRDLARDRFFDYNNPEYFYFDPPIQIYPGDELRTQCTYHSEWRNKMTYDGYGAHQEMCFAFIYYYPRVEDSGLKCANIERYSYCELDQIEDYSYLYKHSFGECNLKKFEKMGFVSNVLNSCGYYPEVCTGLCKKHVDLMFNHDCLQGILGERFHDAMTERDLAIATSVWQAKDRCKNFVEIESSAWMRASSWLIQAVVALISLWSM